MNNRLTADKSICGEYDDPVVSSANQSTHTANNPRKYRVRQYDMDKIFNDRKSKCDYLVLNDVKKYAYFIELKTKSNIKKSEEQINAAIKMLESELPGYSHRLRIIAKLPRPHIKPRILRDWELKHNNARSATDGKYIENV